MTTLRSMRPRGADLLAFGIVVAPAHGETIFARRLWVAGSSPPYSTGREMRRAPRRSPAGGRQPALGKPAQHTGWPRSRQSRTARLEARDLLMFRLGHRSRRSLPRARRAAAP